MIVKNIYHKELAFVVLGQPFAIKSGEIRTVNNIVAVELLKNSWIVEYEMPKEVEIPFFETEKVKKSKKIKKRKVKKPVIKRVKKNISKVESNKISKD